MTADTHPASIDNAAENFELEPSEPGVVPQRVIDELRQAYAIAKDHTQAYSDAAKAQAEKHKVAPGALKKYIAALENDSLDALNEETDDLERLIGQA